MMSRTLRIFAKDIREHGEIWAFVQAAFWAAHWKRRGAVVWEEPDPVTGDFLFEAIGGNDVEEFAQFPIESELPR